MKRNKFLLLLLLFFLGGFMQSVSAAINADSSIFYLKQTDGHEDYTITKEITFRPSETGKTPPYVGAGVCFSPANENELIQITIEDIDLLGTDALYLRLYNGYVKTAWSMPSSHFEQIGSEAKGRTYTSESEDGKFTIGYRSQNSSTFSENGWTIKVRSIPTPDMEYDSTVVFLNSADINRGGRNQILLGFNVKTEGKNNPFSITNILLEHNIPLSIIDTLRVYSTGKISSFSPNTLVFKKQKPSSPVSIDNNIALSSGSNYYWVVADIIPDAVSGTELPISLSSVTVGGEVKTPDNLSVLVPMITSDILIQKEHLVYTVDGSVNFYDDGGKNGKISKDFEGSITFVPADSQKKLMIDFSKLEIFNTSTVGYNDVFKFYNGQVVDESQLITTLLKDKEVVKSTADDGSITVTLKSVTGTAVNGWEAVVSEFTPTNMILENIGLSQALTTTLTAGSTNETFIRFNVQTANTLNSLKLENITIDAGGTTKLSSLTNAKVYVLGRDSTFSTSKIFGEINVEDNSIIEISGEQNLIEGNNYFMLTYDIVDSASKDEVISASLVSLKLSDVVETISTTIVADRTIDNVFKTKSGTHNVTIYDVWIFSDGKSSYYPTLYDLVNENRIVTFTPAIAGSVAEINFSSFDVYYADASYGTKAVFEIYSGKTTESANLLWKLDSNAKSKVGPGKVLRSTAADGSMTIKFNAGTTSSYYGGTGWQAIVKPFVNHNMTLENIDVFQASTDAVKPSDSGKEIIGFKLMTEGTLTTLNLTEVKLDLKGSESSIKKVSVLYSAAESDFSSAVLFGSTTALSEEVIISGSQTLPEGVSYFWVSYDINDDVESNVAIDASLVSLNVGEGPHTPINGDPEGSRLAKNTIELQVGDSGQKILTRTLSFYDDGGENNEYSYSFDGKITFLPSKPGDVVKLKFNQFRTNASHYFYIYSGTEVNEDNLLAKLSSTTFPESIISTSEDGAMTVHFVSTSSGFTYLGWDAEVFSYTPLSLSVDSIIASSVGSGEVLRGSSKVAIQQVKVFVGGDKGSVTLNNFKFNKGITTEGSDITVASLYYTGLSSGFLADNQFGQDAATSPFIFTQENGIDIGSAGVYYFWLAYDIYPKANPGNKIGAEMESLLISGQVTSEIAESLFVDRTIKAGLKGTYIIGASDTAHYSNFKQAMDAVKEGIEGAVVFKAEPGDYKENVLVSSILGTSTNNTITFTSLSGNNNDVVISGKGYSEPPYGDQKYGMFAVESTPYVILENISLIPTSQSYPYNLHVLKESRYFTVRNCVLKADMTINTSGMKHIYTESPNEEGRNNDYIVIENNIFIGGYLGVDVGGTGFVALTKERGAIIRGNNLSDQGGKSIYVRDEDDALVEKNIISSTRTTKEGYWGIDIYRNKGRVIVRNNKITISQNLYSLGIEFRTSLFGTKETPVLVYNNSVSLTNAPSTSAYGIKLADDSKYVSFFNNTVNLSGTKGYCIGVSGTKVTTSDILFQNNLVQNNTSSPLFFFNKEEHYKVSVFKNNVYYLADAVTFAGNNATTWYSNFDAWNTAVGDTGSFVEKANFFSETDLHLKSAGNLNAGRPVSFITTDIEGTTRNATSPTIGAYEYETVVVEVPKMEFGYPRIQSITDNTVDVSIKLNQSGKLYYMISRVSEDAPSVDMLKVKDSVDVSSGEEKTISFLGLMESTKYKAYFAMVSVFNQASEVMTTDTIATPKKIYPLQVDLPAQWDWVDAGTLVSIYPVVSGGVYPYNYVWKNVQNITLCNDSVLAISPTVVSRYILTVSDAEGTAITLCSDVYVNCQSKVAHFEDLHLTPEAYEHGYKNSGEQENVFYSGSYSFTNVKRSNYWGGFAYSNITTTDYDPLQPAHQYLSATGGGVNGSSNFAVVYVSDNNFHNTEIGVMHDMWDGDYIPGVFLTNSPYTLYSVNNGDDWVGDPYAQGDYYKVIFTGFDINGTSTGNKECYLVDYRSANSAEHFALTNWKWFDLSSLGQVAKVVITVDASRKNAGGITLPTFFCMDNFGSEESVEIPLLESVKLDRNDISIQVGDERSLVASINPSNVADVVLRWSSNNKLIATVDSMGKVVALQEGSAVITVTATANNVIRMDSCFVTIISQADTIKLESVTLSMNEMSLQVGDEHFLIATTNPTNATNAYLTWNSTNDSVVMVDSVGRLTAIQEGEALIVVMAKAYGVMVMDSCVVKVTFPPTTGVDYGLLKKDDVLVYPNPAVQFIIVNLENVDGIVPVEIYNMYGVRCFQQNFLGGTKYSIMINEYSKGVYIVRMGSKIRKFIKQ